jgi:ABC-type thiamin/hydroxymethylpyrimidine transport system permease subunit
MRRQTLYRVRLIAVIAILSLVVGVVFVWVDQRAGVVAALAAGVVLAPILGWTVSRVVVKRR